MFVTQQPRQRDLLHVVVPVVGVATDIVARQRRERAKAADGLLQIARARDAASQIARSAPSSSTVSRGTASPRVARRARSRRRGSASRSSGASAIASSPASRKPRADAASERSPSSASRSASEKPGDRRRRRRARARPRTAATAASSDVRRADDAELARRRCAAGSAAGGASTCTSNTRTNVVSRAVQLPPHLVGHHADGDRGRGCRARAAHRRRCSVSPCCHAARPAPSSVDHARHPLPIFCQSASATARRLRRRRDLLRPRPREAFGRPLARGVDAHLAAVGRQIAGVLEVVHRPARELDVALRIVVRADDPGDLRLVLHVDVLVDDDDRLREHQLAEPPARVHDLARVARDSACRSR